MSHQGGTKNDQAAKALLQYRKTPLPYIKLSLAQLLLHRNLCNHIPQEIIQKKSASGNRMLLLVIFDKMPFFPKIVLF